MIPWLGCLLYRMKSFSLLFTFLTYVSHVFAAPHSRVSESGVYEFSVADARRALDIILHEDNPQLLSECFGDRHYISYDITVSSIIFQLVEHNRFRSFISFFPRVNFASGRISRIFDHAARSHRFEICDYMLSVATFSVGSAWSDSLVGWDMDQVRVLIARHQDRIYALASGIQSLWFGSDAQVILANLEVIEYCRSINHVFAEKPGYHPSTLLQLVLQNRNLDDGEMARVLGKALSMGPVVDAAAVKEFQASHPDFGASNQLLSEYLDTPTKEPDTN